MNSPLAVGLLRGSVLVESPLAVGSLRGRWRSGVL